MKSLVVDDDFVSRKIIQNFLLKHGEVDIATDGKEAINAYVIALNEHKPYNLICLDIMMPGINGKEVLRTIKNLEEKNLKLIDKRVKIIMTSSLDSSENILGAFKDQAAGYLIKPITLEKFNDTLDKIGVVEKKYSVKNSD
ncbi:MAG: response regulator [Candidatus Cloacimonadota bacterium]|nr:response regulator [Candidatus Cloacimonadota bacterium]